MNQKKKLTDIHVHLEQYTTKELELVLNHAHDAGVEWIVTSGMDAVSSARAIGIASDYDHVLASVGIHPWIAAAGVPDNIYERIHLLAGEDVTVAIGEVGLDFVDNVFTGVTYHENEDLCKAQELVFRKQIELACALKLPLIMHARGAYSALISILKDERAYRVGGVIHNFDGDTRAAHQLLDMGFYLSFGGAITYPSADILRKTARHIPVNHILIETDSPYMPLHKQKADKNEPANVALVAKTLAELKKQEVDDIFNETYRNFTALLNIRD